MGEYMYLKWNQKVFNKLLLLFEVNKNSDKINSIFASLIAPTRS